VDADARNQRKKQRKRRNRFNLKFMGWISYPAHPQVTFFVEKVEYNPK